MNLDPVVTKRLELSRARHASWKPRWAECLAMWEGRQFVVRSAASNRIVELETRAFGSKEEHRARLSNNRIEKYVMAEVSLGTQRVPQYEVTPTNTDPEVIAAARLGERVLMYLYDFLNLRKHLVEAYQYAVNTGEGFIRPYWNPKGGDRLPDVGQDGKPLYTGEIAIDTYGPQEVIWEAGVRFERSGWHAIETTMSIDEAKALPDYIGGEDLKPDSRAYDSFTTGQLSRSGPRPNAIRVTEYLELPSDRFPGGRRFWIANNEQITETKGYPYLCPGPQGYEPCIRKMTFIPTPHRDRDMGLTEHLLDPQRTLNDCINKAVEWKNLAIAPQILAPVGSMRARPTNKAGAIREYQPIAGQKPEWQPVPDIPQSLFMLADKAVENMEEIASLRSLPSQIESGKGIAAFTERDQSVRAFIVQGLADFHSGLGKVLLYLTAENYDEPRLLAIQGREGLDFIPAFKGSQLKPGGKHQINVNVLPGSIEPRTRAAVEQKVLSYADRGWISPQEAMAAIDGGTAESLVDDYELDVAKQQREIQAMKAIGQGVPGADVPIAAPFDNHDVHLYQLHKWMKTTDFERQPDTVRQAASLHEQQHQMLQAQDQAQAQAAQMQTAQELGAANATRPPSKPMPDQPRPEAG